MFAASCEVMPKQVVVMSDSAFAPWLARELRRREWSQADLARKLNPEKDRPGTGAVSMWVTGSRIPSPQSIERIADVLRVDVDYLLTLAKHRPEVFDVDPDSAEAQLIPLIRQIDWASRPGRLEEMQAELRMMIEFDQRRKKAVRGGDAR